MNAGQPVSECTGDEDFARLTVLSLMLCAKSDKRSDLWRPMCGVSKLSHPKLLGSEFSLTALVYNICHVLNTFVIDAMIAAVRR